jgi:hypothetical protein
VVTESETVASAELPAELVAINVYEVELKMPVGVPEITQVVAFTVAHEGSAVVPPFIAQPVILAPLPLTVVGLTDMAVPTIPAVPVALL